KRSQVLDARVLEAGRLREEAQGLRRHGADVRGIEEERPQRGEGIRVDRLRDQDAAPGEGPAGLAEEREGRLRAPVLHDLDRRDRAEARVADGREMGDAVPLLDGKALAAAALDRDRIDLDSRGRDRRLRQELEQLAAPAADVQDRTGKILEERQVEALL